MPASLEQINVSYSADEDRLLLKARGGTGEEFRVWMTRRFVRLLLQVIEKSLRGALKESPAGGPMAQAAQIAFEHDEMTARADFSTPYQESASSFPIGEDGILGYRINIGNDLLHLLPREGAGIALPLKSSLLHNLQHLICQAADAADWDLPEKLKPMPPAQSPRTLN